MFNKNLYITRGIHEHVPEEIINILWSLIHEHEGHRPLDYLQVFELKSISTKTGKSLKIKWSQEQPPFNLTVYFPSITTEIDTKIWVICTGENTEEEYSTMLFPEEY